MSARKKRSARRVGELLPGLAQELGLEDELRAARAIASWQRLVEEQVPPAAASRLLEVRPPVLVVSAPDAITGQELRLRAPELLDAFAVAPGGQRLRELQVVVRPPPAGDSERPR